MSDQLPQAIALIKSGHRQQGRQLLANILKANPRQEAAWLWLSSVMDTDEQRRYCLNQVLIINPHHELAQRGLEKLKTDNQTEPKPIPQQQTISPLSIQSSSPPEVTPHQISPEKPIQSTPPPTVQDKSNFGLGCLGAMVGLVLSLVFWGFLVNQFRGICYTEVGLGVMALALGGAIGGMTRVLGQGNRPTFGIIAAMVSFVGYFLGSYLGYSLVYGKNFNDFVLLTTFTLPMTFILSLSSMVLSFVIAFRWQPRPSDSAAAAKPGMSAKGWIAVGGLIAVLGCMGAGITLSGARNMGNIMVGLLMMLVGLFPLAAAYFNWDWFMRSRRARLFVRLLGRNGARMFYALLGLGLALFGLLIGMGSG